MLIINFQPLLCSSGAIAFLSLNERNQGVCARMLNVIGTRTENYFILAPAESLSNSNIFNNFQPLFFSITLLQAHLVYTVLR